RPSEAPWRSSLEEPANAPACVVIVCGVPDRISRARLHEQVFRPATSRRPRPDLANPVRSTGPLEASGGVAARSPVSVAYAQGGDPRTRTKWKISPAPLLSDGRPAAMRRATLATTTPPRPSSRDRPATAARELVRLWHANRAVLQVRRRPRS